LPRIHDIERKVAQDKAVVLVDLSPVHILVAGDVDPLVPELEIDEGRLGLGTRGHDHSHREREGGENEAELLHRPPPT
jgi:hypothetical protein